MLNWAQRFDTFCFLDNHGYQIEPHSQECLLAAGIQKSFSADAGNALDRFQEFKSMTGPCWLFGHLGYDLKNEIDTPGTSRPDRLHFPDLFFFQPSVVVRINEKQISIDAGDPGMVWTAIHTTRPAENEPAPGLGPLKIQNRLSEHEYLSVIRRLREHILRGDCYEINFCQEFFAEKATIDPLTVYRKLSQVSPNPFSALYRTGEKWLICASPERFLRKQGNSILSQPIKGTSSRSKEDSEQDEANKQALYNSQKDRSENVMIVDLVRNDLARVCKEGTVHVDELYGVYSFPQVHQLISTVSGELETGVSFAEIIKACFPMGSMTGAPKKKVMELIDKYEVSKRGIFSGALGYISPTDDFDFNVVIRSLLYNQSEQYLSFPAGSGITFYSQPEKEWEECLLKAAAIKLVLDQ